MAERVQRIKEVRGTDGSLDRTTRVVETEGNDGPADTGGAHAQSTAVRIVWYVDGIITVILGARFVLAQATPPAPLSLRLAQPPAKSGKVTRKVFSAAMRRFRTTEQSAAASDAVSRADGDAPVSLSVVMGDMPLLRR